MNKLQNEIKDQDICWITNFVVEHSEFTYILQISLIIKIYIAYYFQKIESHLRL